MSFVFCSGGQSKAQFAYPLVQQSPKAPGVCDVVDLVYFSIVLCVHYQLTTFRIVQNGLLN